MKNLFAVILFLSLIVPLAQARQAPKSLVKYWVYFTDKGAIPTAEVCDPLIIDPKAIERRKLRGHAVPEAFDLPPNSVYIDRIQSLGLEVSHQSRWLNAVSAWLTPAQKQEVLGLEFVRAVHPVGRLMPERDPSILPLVFATHSTTSHAYSFSYGSSFNQLEIVNAINPIERGIIGTGVRLGFLDTGLGNINLHPAFAKMISEGRFVETRDFTGQPDDLSRHGRSVISVAAGFDDGTLIGPAFGAEIIHARTEYTPTETNQEEDNFVAGLEWLESMGVDVVNVSLGYSEFDAGQKSYTTSDMDGNTAVTTIAADIAAKFGVVMVNSAGNEGCGSPSQCWYFITSPADGDSVITVGAVNSFGNHSSFSSFGPTADGRIKPDVSAQGENVWLAAGDADYGFSQGTSFSSPMVAGIATAMLQANPKLTPIQVRDILRETASQATTPDNSLGWGIVDADAAIKQAEAMATGTDSNEAPLATVAISVFPNPFNERTTFEINRGDLPTHVRLEIYDILGRRVAVPFDGNLSTGPERIAFDAGALPSGVYIYKLNGSAISKRGTLVLER